MLVMTWWSVVFSSVRIGHWYQLIALHFAFVVTLEPLQGKVATYL